MSATTVDVHEAQARLLQLVALALKGDDVRMKLLFSAA